MNEHDIEKLTYQNKNLYSENLELKTNATILHEKFMKLVQHLKEKSCLMFGDEYLISLKHKTYLNKKFEEGKAVASAREALDARKILKDIGAL